MKFQHAYKCLTFYILVIIIPGMTFAQAWGWESPDPQTDYYQQSIHADSISNSFYGKLIRFYKRDVSPLQGRRCPCYPSCSTFTLYAMQQYGFLPGLLMGVKRLYFRENRDLFRRHHYWQIKKEGMWLAYDPPELNNPFPKKDWRLIHPQFQRLLFNYNRNKTSDSPLTTGKVTKAGSSLTHSTVTPLSIWQTLGYHLRQDLHSIRQQAQRYAAEGQDFLSYSLNLYYYDQAPPGGEKMNAGLEALQTYLDNDRLLEAESLISRLAADFPELEKQLTYQYGYALLKGRKLNQGMAYLEALSTEPMYQNRVNLLFAYAHLQQNHIEKSITYLSQIKTGEYGTWRRIHEIESALGKKPSYSRKSKYIAGAMSAVLPGSGQAYAGFWFNAVQSFGFNLLLGYGSYAGWQYTLDKPRKGYEYILPSLSTIAFSVFYFSNIMGGMSAAERSNLYQESRYYGSILKKFRVLVNEQHFLLSIRENL